ncbi:hypothetical protein [Nocardia sp. NPDC058658]
MLKQLKDFAIGIHAANAIRHGIRPPAAARPECGKARCARKTG